MIDQFTQITSPFGVKPIKSYIAAPFNSTIIEMIVPDTDATPIFINDTVKTVNNADLSGEEFGIEYCAKASHGEPIRGIVVGFKVIHEFENSTYRKAYTRRAVRLCQDPFLICQARVNAVILAADVNRYIDIDAGAGNTTTGISSIQLDYATIKDTGGQFRITKILDIINTDDNKYTIVECVIQNHEFLEGASSSGDLWARIGTTLYPINAGDDVNIGGKLTVDGLIDPTGLALTPQVAPPLSDDGLHYYDSALGFQFRENGLWNKLTYTGTTTIQLGGIPPGTTFDKEPLYSFLQQAAAPYIRPTFTAFALSGITNIEVGTKLTGVKTFTWTISNPANVAENTVNITDTTNVIQLITGHVKASPATYDFTLYPGGGLQYSAPATNTWKIDATDTGVPPAGLSRNTSVNWLWKKYYGTNANAVLTPAMILALTSQTLSNTGLGSYAFAAAVGEYKFIVIQEDLPQPTVFKDLATNSDVAMATPYTVAITNDLGVSTNVIVYRTFNQLGGAMTIVAS